MLPTIFGLSLEVYIMLLIIAEPTWFFWRWITGRFMQAGPKRKWTRWILTFISVPLIYLGIIVIWIMSLSWYPTDDFERKRWLTDTEKRYEMSADLIESGILIGKTKREVRALLGDEGQSEESDYWMYGLGFRPGLFNIDPDVLEIHFEKGRVVRVGQHQT